MGAGVIDGGMDTTHLSAADREARNTRDDQARRYIEKVALRQPEADREAWRGDILDALGLRPQAGPPPKRPRAPVGQFRHGTVHGYNKAGCRCDKCRAAEREYRRSRQLKGGPR